jgi:hypothetical protein
VTEIENRLDVFGRVCVCVCARGRWLKRPTEVCARFKRRPIYSQETHSFKKDLYIQKRPICVGKEAYCIIKAPEAAAGCSVGSIICFDVCGLGFRVVGFRVVGCRVVGFRV